MNELQKQQNEIDDEYAIPSRKVLHPSDRTKYTRYFYRTLFVLFIILTIVLVVWGKMFRSHLE